LWGETVTPVYQTTAFSQMKAQQLADIFQGRAGGYNYSRIANPTCTTLEMNLCSLDEGIGCVVTSSGMAAITAVACALLQSGDHVVLADGIFAGTISLFLDTLSRFGIQTTLVDAADTDAVASAMRPQTRMVLLETIGNPKLDIPDIPAISKLTRDAGIPLVLDNTVLTAALLRPKQLGVDIVVYSTSKFICGFGTAIGGAVIDTGLYDWSRSPFEQIRTTAGKAGPLAFMAYLRNIVCRNLGGCPAPWNCFLINQGLQTLSIRMARHLENASRLANYLRGHKAVKSIRYPGLPSDPFYERARRLLDGKAGAIMTIFLGDREKAFEFIDRLELLRQAPNIGDSKTLVIHPASTIFWQLSPQDRKRMGITEDMVRISVGLEDFDDIKADVCQALEVLGG